MYEMTFEYDGNEEVVGEFMCDEHEPVNVYGFRSLDSTITIRFYPQYSGTYRYCISGGINTSGALYCESAPLSDVSGCDAGGKGIVRACGTHFAYDNGEWFYPFGTTVYALAHQEDELIDQTMETLSKSPFNKVRMCVFPKHYSFNENEPEYFAFCIENSDSSINTSKPCYEFWDAFENRIRQLDALGIQCDLILFHPYDRWGFANLSLEQAKEYLDYAIRRLAAFPNVWWSLANEFDLMKYTKEEWEEIAAFIHEHDPFGHLLSNHNCIEFWNFDNKDTTHVCIQVKDTTMVSGMIREYNKPLIVDECCYEGNIEYEWGNISAFEMVNRFWMAVVQGGYCTHGETFLSDDDVLWWSKGGVLKGESPSRITFLRSLVETLPGPIEYCGYEFTKERYDAINADPSVADNDFWLAVARAPWDRAKGAMLTGKEYMGRAYNDKTGDEVYIKYLERKCAAITTINLPSDKAYDISVIDVWNMTETKTMSGVSGKVTVALPRKEGMAVMARSF